MTVGEMMTREIISCSPNETLSDAATKMADGNFGCCPVLDNGRLVGLVTDRDITVRAVARGLDPKINFVRDIMSTNVIVASPSMSDQEAAQLMADYQIRRLPVVDNGKVVGIISLADLAIDVEEEEMIAHTVGKISLPVL